MLTLAQPHLMPGVTWTILVEFQFYMVFPFLLLFWQRYGVRYLLGIIVAAFVCRVGIWASKGTVQDLGYFTIFGRIDQFVLGMLFFTLYRSHPRIFSNRLLLPFACGVWCYFYHRFNVRGGFYHRTSYPTPSSVWIYLPTLEGAFYGLMTAAWLSYPVRLPARIDKSLAWLGKLSFSFYLNHVLVLTICTKLTAKAGWSPKDFPTALLWCLIVALPAVTLVSVLTYHVIEYPFLAMRKRYLQPLEGNQAHAAPGAGAHLVKNAA
jgi:peptidoglycan/LPS O-acetylase OafA/YrhL